MGLVIIDREKFPICVRKFKELIGISIYKCIRNNDIREGDSAHAHCFDNDLHQGWICLKHEHMLYEKYTLLHEVAHLIADKRIWELSSYTILHGNKWREVVQSIGGTYGEYLSYDFKIYKEIPNDENQIINKGKQMLAIQKFLIDGGTIDLLKEKFAIDARRHGEYPNLVLFKYDQIDSPFSEEIVREARGIVLDEKNNWAVVCWSMYKFFNQGEFYAAEINWKTAKVYEKLDGSLIQIFPYDGKWLVATSGSFASGNVGDHGFTFNDLFYKTFRYKFPSTDCGKCFFFELTSLFNKIIVVHPEPKITLLGGRDLVGDLQEISLDEAHKYFPDCDRVKTFPLQSFSDIVESFKTFSGLKQEGYVVFDGFNRQKCKHPEYTAAHHLKDSLGSKRSIVNVVRSGEIDEVISTLPEYKEVILEAKNRFDELINSLESEYEKIKDLQPQKTFALAAVKTRYSPALFAFRANKTNSIRSFFSQIHIDRLVELLNYKTNE